MAQRNTYAVFIGEKWGRTNNLREAKRLARYYKGTVRRMGCNRDSWDAPTFRACSELVADFRQQP